MAFADPYTATMDGLWRLLEESPAFTELIPPGNRVKFLGPDRDPVKQEVATADLPEVRIIPVTSTPHPWRTSNSHSDLCTYEIQCSSGDQRVNKYHNLLKWIVYQAMKDAEPWLRKNVRWGDSGELIIKSAHPVSVREGVAEPDLNRGIIGWAGLWAIEVELWFSHAMLA